jgi:putative Holliday junction resolvase
VSAERYLGIDYGTKRIGLAVSSPIGTVHPRPRLDRTGPEDDIRALVALIRDEAVTALVIGLPHHMDGAQSEMEAEARNFGVALAQACELPLFGTDERLTSAEADRILKVQGRRNPRARKERVDSAAACILLQDFLAAEESAERIA